MVKFPWQDDDDENTNRATVSLGSVVIDAPPEKVYAKLARAREWEGWLSAARLVHTAQPEALETGNTFCCTSRLVFGFVDGIVEDAEPSKVLKWGDKALFGLIRGEMRWQLRREGGGARTLFIRKPKTIVSLGIETTGPLGFLVGGKRLESYTNQWLDELTEACIGNEPRRKPEEAMH